MTVANVQNRSMAVDAEDSQHDTITVSTTIKFNAHPINAGGNRVARMLLLSQNTCVIVKGID